MKSLSLEEKLQVFGDYRPHVNSEGIPTRLWEGKILVPVELPAPLPLAWDKEKKVSIIRCHKLIAPFLKNALDTINGVPGLWDTIDDYGGCYNFRLQRKSTSSLSSHCWGIAVDLDVADNPFGKQPKVDHRIVQIFYDNGFLWGGTFLNTRKDGMHFEFADLTKLG